MFDVAYVEIFLIRVKRVWSRLYSPDNTISTLSKLFGHIVAFINDEVLVEDLEDLPPL